MGQTELFGGSLCLGLVIHGGLLDVWKLETPEGGKPVRRSFLAFDCTCTVWS